MRIQITRNILYSHDPKDLTEAFTKAQTVYYDNQYLQLDQSRDAHRNNQQRGQSRSQHQQNASKNWGIQQQPQGSPGVNVNMNCNQPQQPMKSGDKPNPMKVDTSNQFRQNMNWQQPNQQPNNPSRPITQQPPRFQRINQLQDNQSDPNEGYEGDVCGEIPDDLISNTSHESIKSNAASTFLSA